MEKNDEVFTIVDMLKVFISGEDRTIVFVGKIEITLDLLFSEEDEVQDYVTYFASYRPEGGDFLYDEKTMVDESMHLLKLIQSRYSL